LAVTVATAYALLNSLRVPRKVVVDDQIAELKIDKRRIEHAHRNVPIGAMRADGAHDDDVISFAFEGGAKLLFAESLAKLPGVVEDVDAVVDGFGDHIVHLSLISNGAEMEAAHSQD
jgi:hypothetical protein